jgi:arginine-tRNA-protein transferase
MKVYNDIIRVDDFTPSVYDQLLEHGCYRMQQHIFRATHWKNNKSHQVHRLWWLRYHIPEIKSHRSHQKILSKNNKFNVFIEPHDHVSAEDEILFGQYKSNLKFETYATLYDCLYGKSLQNLGLFNTWSIGVYDRDILISKAIIDLGENTVLAKVNLYNHSYLKYSPGKFLILKTIEFMKEKSYDWYYPGYVMVDNPCFDYKLFLGKESAQYYSPDEEVWKPYNDKIMEREILSKEDHDFIYNVVFRFWR